MNCRDPSSDGPQTTALPPWFHVGNKNAHSIRPCDINAAVRALIAARASASIIVPPEGLGTSGWRGADDLLAADPSAGAGQRRRRSSHCAVPVQRQARRLVPGASCPATGATNRQPPSLHIASAPSRPSQAPVAPAATIQHWPVRRIGRRRRRRARPRRRMKRERRSAPAPRCGKAPSAPGRAG